MAWKHLDPTKFDADKARHWEIKIEKMREEAKKARYPVQQADGGTVLVIDFEQMHRLQQAADKEQSKYLAWFHSCLE